VTELTLVQAVNRGLQQAMRDDPDVLVLGEDVGVNGGVFRATEGLLKEFGEERVLDTPLSETGIIGTAVGMALYGLKPVAEIQFLDFIYPAFDQIVSELAKFRYRSGGQYPCHVVIRTPYGGGIKGGLYHSQSTEAYFAHTAGLKVVIPSTPADAKGLLKSSIRCDDPVIFLESEKMLNETGDVPEDKEFTLPLGVANVERVGADVTVVSYGRPMQRVVRSAVDALVKDHDVDVELIDLRTLRPMDAGTVLASIKKTHRCVIVDEDWGYCGMGSGILHKLQKAAFDDLDAPIEYVHSDEIPVPFNHYLEEAMMPSVDRIVSAVKEVCYR